MSGAPVALLGGSGFVGCHLAKTLRREGFEVASMSRSGTAPVPGVAAGRLALDAGPAAIAAALPAGGVVVNLVDTGGEPEEAASRARDLVIACGRAGAARLVHLSTAVVVGPAARGRIDEDTPPRPADDYQRRKLAVEVALRQAAAGEVDLVVLRPTAVFGPGGRNLASLAASLADGPVARDWLRACLFARRRMHLVPVETVVSAARWAIVAPGELGGEVFHVAADEDDANRFRPVERALLRGLGRRDHSLPPLPLPLSLLELVLFASGRRRVSPRARFSSARLAARGVVPAIPLLDAVSAYGDWWRTHAASREGPR